MKASLMTDEDEALAAQLEHARAENDRLGMALARARGRNSETWLFAGCAVIGAVAALVAMQQVPVLRDNLPHLAFALVRSMVPASPEALQTEGA